MSRVIWKYPITVRATFTLDMPEGTFEVLTVQLQNGVPYLWALVDPMQPKTPHTFRVVATGEAFDDDALVYVGTFQPSNGLVFHLFQEF